MHRLLTASCTLIVLISMYIVMLFVNVNKILCLVVPVYICNLIEVSFSGRGEEEMDGKVRERGKQNGAVIRISVLRS